MITIDVIGTLYNPGTYDAQGNELTAPVALPGWHVNTSYPVSAWAAKRVTPATPRRVFGGATTIFYTFADKAEFDAAASALGIEPGASVINIAIPAPAPMSVTPRQIRMALTQAGLRSAVEAAVAAGDQDLKDWWFESNAFERDRPQVLAMAALLGVSDAQLEALWTLADTL